MRFCALVISLACLLNANAQPHPVNSFPGVHAKRGKELYQEGRFNAAIAQFETALKEDPSIG